MELKPPQNSSKNNKKSLEKSTHLEKSLEKNPDSFKILYELYECYIDLSNTSKKIECLEKMIKIRPSDPFPLGQLSQIYYGELQNPEKGKYYQDKANKINSNKFL